MPSSTASRQARGRTSWGRSALLFVPGVAAVAAIVVGMANGAIAAQFGVANSNMKLSIDKLDAAKVQGYVGSDSQIRSGKEGILLLGVGGGTADNLCLSTVVDVPIVGAVSLNVGAGGQQPVGIDSLTANAKELLASTGVLTAAELGRDGSTVDQNSLLKGPGGSWGLQADGLLAEKAKLTATNGAASQLRLTGVSIKVLHGTHECF